MNLTPTTTTTDHQDIQDDLEGLNINNTNCGPQQQQQLRKSPQISIISDGSLLRTPHPLEAPHIIAETNERLTTKNTSADTDGIDNKSLERRRASEGVSSSTSKVVAAKSLSTPSPLPLLQSLSTSWTKRGNKESVSFHTHHNQLLLDKDGGLLGSGDLQDGLQVQNQSLQSHQIQNHPSALAVAVPHNPWDRILQCFQVFKPKKVSASDDEDVSSKKHLGAGNKNKESSNSSPASAGLKKIMTEGDLFLYELAEKSEILKDDEAVQIGKILPPRAIGYPWDLRFTTSIDGFSLHSLYRKMDGIESPVLLILETVDERGVLGAILSTAPRVAESFYGGSDTALLKLRPLPFCHYPWSGANFYFIQGHDDFLSIGSDGGKFGLWLDDNLYNGRTEACGTFGSPPLIPEGDFKVKTLEVFTLASLA